MTDEAKTGLPAWAKVLMGLVVVGVVGVIIFIVGSVMFIGNIQKEATDPKHIQQVVKTIADIPNPPPAEFQYQYALDIAGISTVVLERKSDRTQLTMIQFPVPNDRDTLNSKDLVEQVAKQGFPSEKAASAFDISSTATDTVAGEQMSYAIGTATTKAGEKLPGFIGAIVAKNANKVFLFFGTTPGDSYNMTATQELLHSIRRL